MHALLIQNPIRSTVAPTATACAAGFARDDLFVVRARAVHDRDRALGRHRAAGDDVHGARRPLSGRRPHATSRSAPKLIEPPGECRSNHEVICKGWRRGSARSIAGFEMTAMEIIDATLRASGWPDAATVRARALDRCRTPFEQAHFLNGFPQPDKRFHFAPDWAALGPNHACMPRAARSHASIDATTRGAAVPPGDGAGAQLPEHQLHRDARVRGGARSGRRC